MQRNIKLRNQIINYVRDFMNNEGFMELATPILTALLQRALELPGTFQIT